MSVRVLRNKFKVLCAILDRHARLVCELVMACPALLRTGVAVNDVGVEALDGTSLSLSLPVMHVGQRGRDVTRGSPSTNSNSSGEIYCLK